MEKLNRHDLQRLHLAVSELHSETDPSSLSRRTLSAVQKAVDFDFLAFDSFGNSGRYLDTQWNSDGTILTEELKSEFARLFNDDPTQHPLAHLLGGPQFRVEKFSDHVTDPQFVKTGLYNEFFRRIEVRHQIAFLIATESGAKITCAANRQKPDFTERDRQLLIMLAPHLASAIRTAVEIRRLQERQVVFETALAKTSRALVTVSTNGDIVDASELGLALITKYFGALSVSLSLPEELLRWMSSVTDQQRNSFGSPMYRRLENSNLRIDAVPDEGRELISLLLHERTEPVSCQFRVIGLSDRESEVMYWVAKGKTDEVIAVLCGIGVRTVNKHLEHIFRKLGVETRIAAVQRIAEFGLEI